MKEISPVKRRLTAILAADAVGYSARMAEDEERTLRTLAGHRRHIDGLIADHDGRLVGTAGDSVLAEFGSSVEAVRCAVEIQEALATRNESLPEAERLHFRIGVNLGDVIVDGADILGDGVNVASRLEGIAEPGGICIASSVFDQISGKLNLGFEDIGERSLKNIGRPVRAYRVAHAHAPLRPRPVSRRNLAAVVAGVAVLVVAVLAGFYLGGAASGRNEPSSGAVPSAQSAAPATVAQQPAPQQASPAAGATPTPPPVPGAIPSTPARATTPAVRSSADAGPASSAGTPAISLPAPAQEKPAATGSFTMGLAQARCRRPDGNFSAPARGRARVIAGEVIITLGQPGEPGSVDLRGRPGADGTIVLDGYFIPPGGRARGTKVAARYEGRLTGGRGMLTGTQGGQRCTIGLQLK